MFNVERLADERKHQTLVTLCAASYYSFTLIEYHPLYALPPARGLRGAPTAHRLGTLSAMKRNWYLTALYQ